MKPTLFLAAASLTLFAGSAVAGGCVYGQKAAMADAHDAAEEPIAEEGLNPELLALLKKREKESLEESLVVPNVPN